MGSTRQNINPKQNVQIKDTTPSDIKIDGDDTRRPETNTTSGTERVLSTAERAREIARSRLTRQSKQPNNTKAGSRFNPSGVKLKTTQQSTTLAQNTDEVTEQRTAEQVTNPPNQTFNIRLSDNADSLKIPDNVLLPVHFLHFFQPP